MPCVNGLNSPLDDKQLYSLMASTGAGCGALGTDDHALTADSQDEWDWY
jgi:hypothetical protein